MKNSYFLYLICCILFNTYLLNNDVFAQDKEPILDGQYYNWYVISLTNEYDEKVCYMLNYSNNSDGNIVTERKPYLLISYFKNKSKIEVSVVNDFNYKSGSSVFMLINDIQHKMFTENNIAWAQKESDDFLIIKQLSATNKVKTKAEFPNNKYVIDSYNIKGFLVAYNRLKQLCN